MVNKRESNILPPLRAQADGNMQGGDFTASAPMPAILPNAPSRDIPIGPVPIIERDRSPKRYRDIADHGSPTERNKKPQLCSKCSGPTMGYSEQDDTASHHGTNVDVSVLVGDSHGGSETQRLLLEISERLKKLEEFVGD